MAYRYFDKYKLADWIKEAADLGRAHYRETAIDPLRDSWIRDDDEEEPNHDGRTGRYP